MATNAIIYLSNFSHQRRDEHPQADWGDGSNKGNNIGQIGIGTGNVGITEDQFSDTYGQKPMRSQFIGLNNDQENPHFGGLKLTAIRPTNGDTWWVSIVTAPDDIAPGALIDTDGDDNPVYNWTGQTIPAGTRTFGGTDPQT